MGVPVLRDPPKWLSFNTTRGALKKRPAQLGAALLLEGNLFRLVSGGTKRKPKPSLGPPILRDTPLSVRGRRLSTEEWGGKLQAEMRSLISRD